MSKWIITGFLSVTVICAAINLVWIILLKDYSYAGITAPFSLVGAITWLGVSAMRWRLWYLCLLPPLSVPFLPWVDWMYG